MRGHVRRAAAALLPIAAALLLSGHVGDDNTYFRGAAGPWRVQVVVRHPGVVPGLADITVRVENGTPERVTVRPVRTAQGLEGAPRADVATPVPGEPDLFAAQLWFMTLGAHSVHVEVAGELGSGTAVVPVMSNATRTLPMGSGLRLALAGLGLFLAVGLLTIVRAAALESTVPADAAPPPGRTRRARVTVAVAALLLALIVTGGGRWWAAEARAYRGILFVPLELRAAATQGDGTAVVDITIADRNWLGQAVSPLVPDHGKLMHAFLVRLPDQDAFAHVHPEPAGPLQFRLAAPPLPAGTYAFYGDIAHENGATQTLVTEIALPGPAAPCDTCGPADPDDAWTAAPASATESFLFDDGLSARWERPAALVAGRGITLRFAVTDAAGRPAALEPYMGMAAHAAVRRDDGAVFVHLHPTGSVSPEVQARLAARAGLMTADEAMHAVHGARAADGVVEIPWAFPQPGRYRIWLQVRAGGAVRTAVWTAEVAPG